MDNQPRPGDTDPGLARPSADDLTPIRRPRPGSDRRRRRRSTSTYSDATRCRSGCGSSATSAGGAAAERSTDRYAPDPGATGRLGDASGTRPSRPTPERWYEPAPVDRSPSRRRVTRRRGTGAGSLVAVALLSAVLASGGTVLTLSATGVLDRPATEPDLGAGHQRRRTAARHDRRVVGHDQRRGQGQPGRRPDHRHRAPPTPATWA